jgi:predicted regulator of Ras-like GTPase activity (Roadblock/LC7/MglB family)
MFKDALQSVVEGTEGGLASLLMDSQGVPVDHYARPEMPFDITTVGAEFGVVVKQIQSAAESLEAGGAHELAVLADKVITIIRAINHEYFLVLAISPTGNIGKARYLLRTTAPKLLPELV